MALLSCPECGGPVSDQAANCPKCGFPIQGDLETGPKPPLPEDARDAEIRAVLLEHGKIAALKRCRELKPGFGLKDAKEYVERLEAQLPPGQKAAQRGAGCLVLLAIIVAGILGVWLAR